MRQEGHVLHLGLGEQEAVEGIVVLLAARRTGQGAHGKDVLVREAERDEPRFLAALGEVRLVEWDAD